MVEPSSNETAANPTTAPSQTNTPSPPPNSPPPTPPATPPPVSKSPPPQSPPPASPPPPQAPPPKEPSPPPPVLSPPPPATQSSPPPPVASPPPPSSGGSTSPSSSPPPPQPKPLEYASPPPSETSPPPPTGTTPVPPGLQPPSPPLPDPSLQSPPPPGTLPAPIIPSPLTPSTLVPPPLPTTPSTGEPPINPTTGNPPTPNATAPTPTPSGQNGIHTGHIVAIGVVAGFTLFSLMGLAFWCLRKHDKKVAKRNGYVAPSPYGTSEVSDLFHMKTQSPAPLLGSCSSGEAMPSPSELSGLGNSRSWFTYKELEEITNGFSSENLLGEGGFGAVYKGCLADGREVAVKQLKVGSAQGEREFRAEVEIISRVHHRHLVSLVGYCISDQQRLLVYDFVPNDDLYHHLHGKNRSVMDWATRSRVAAGAARGIAYLHEDCHPRIIHRDIKSSNILLDSKFEAQVSDFGLAKLAQDAFTHVSTRVVGTFGYMAPEYATSGKLTEKSDVFSFGVVLLELITGRKPVDASQPLGDESLVEWARPLLTRALDSEELDGLVDPKLEKKYVDAEMLRMMEAAAACVRHSATKRPRMGQVMRALDSLGYTADLNNGMIPGESKVYNSAEQSAEIRLFRKMAFGSQDYTEDFYSHNSKI